MLEKAIERYLVQEVNKLGGLCLKFSSPGRRNVPDRIVLWPGGFADFVECKSTTGKCTKGQLREHERLRVLGFSVEVVNSAFDVDQYCLRKGGL